MGMSRALVDIIVERDLQPPYDESLNTQGTWIGYMANHMSRFLLPITFDPVEYSFRNCMVKVGALALAAIEWCDDCDDVISKHFDGDAAMAVAASVVEPIQEEGPPADEVARDHRPPEVDTEGHLNFNTDGKCVDDTGAEIEFISDKWLDDCPEDGDQYYDQESVEKTSAKDALRKNPDVKLVASSKPGEPAEWREMTVIEQAVIEHAGRMDPASPEYDAHYAAAHLNPSGTQLPD